MRQLLSSVPGDNLLSYFSTISWLRLQQEVKWVNINFERKVLTSAQKSHHFQGRTVEGGEVDGCGRPPLSKKVPFLKKKSNNIILYISSSKTSHVYTCLNFTY